MYENCGAAFTPLALMDTAHGFNQATRRCEVLAYFCHRHVLNCELIVVFDVETSSTSMFPAASAAASGVGGVGGVGGGGASASVSASASDYPAFICTAAVEEVRRGSAHIDHNADVVFSQRLCISRVEP